MGTSYLIFKFSAILAPMSATTTRKHPRGLPFLFFTEMWERFGYYLMLGIFFLYMTDIDKGGLALEKKKHQIFLGPTLPWYLLHHLLAVY